jgi:hypothetical protein
MNLPKNIGCIALLITALIVDTATNAIAEVREKLWKELETALTANFTEHKS